MSIRWSHTRVVAADDTSDLHDASDRVSRFGAYLRRHTARLRECDEPLNAAEFAAVVWSIATAPVMSPSYVRLRPDIHAVTPTWDENGEGELMFDVHVRLPHSALSCARQLPGRWHGWANGPSLDDEGSYRPQWEPFRPGNAVLTTTVVRVLPTAGGDLPHGDVRDASLLHDAKASVRAVVAAVNDQAAPVVAALRGDRS